VTFAQIDAAINAIRQRKGSNEKIIIGIDGGVGAGKTTLAAQLVKSQDAQQLSIDWLYQDWQAPFQSEDWEKIADQIIEATLNFQRKIGCELPRFDWSKQSWESVSLSATKDILIIEGVKALSPELISLYDLKIFIEIPPAIGEGRAQKRDSLTTPAQVAALSKFSNSAQEYFQANQLAKKSDFVANYQGN
jgi:uridine kinase